MRRSDARSKAVVLLTDGDSNEGVIARSTPRTSPQKEGVRVYTVQIGNGDDVDVLTRSARTSSGSPSTSASTSR